MDSIGAALQRAAHSFTGSETPRLDAQLLLEHVLGRPRTWLLAHDGEALEAEGADTFARLCERRAQGVPVAYLTGAAGFYRREFFVDEHVLIPRPETEHLVEDAVAYLPPGGRVFEAGTGSGAIACSIAAERPDVAVVASDISEDALRIARENARRLGVAERVAFIAADVVPQGSADIYDALVANLPYVPSAEVPQPPQAAGYEPRLALDGGADGLDLYRRLLGAAGQMLRPGALLLMEAAPPTLPALRALTLRALPGARVDVRRDYAGLERYLHVLTAQTGARPPVGE